MKARLLTIACAFAMLFPGAAKADDVAIAAILRDHKMSAMEAAAVVVVADALGIDADFVISTGSRTKTSPIVYGPAIILSNRSGVPFDKVWAQRGKGWGEVAHSIGMHPGTFNKLRKQGCSVDQIIWMQTLNKKYGLPHDEVWGWHKSGMSQGKVLEMVARCDGDKDKIHEHMNKGKSAGNGHGKPDHAGGPGKGKGKGGG